MTGTGTRTGPGPEMTRTGTRTGPGPGMFSDLCWCTAGPKSCESSPTKFNVTICKQGVTTINYECGMRHLKRTDIIYKIILFFMNRFCEI